MSRDLSLYFDDILQAITYIKEFTRNMTQASFVADMRTQHACIRNLEVIGEAAKALKTDTDQKNQQTGDSPSSLHAAQVDVVIQIVAMPPLEKHFALSVRRTALDFAKLVDAFVTIGEIHPAGIRAVVFRAAILIGLAGPFEGTSAPDVSVGAGIDFVHAAQIHPTLRGSAVFAESPALGIRRATNRPTKALFAFVDVWRIHLANIGGDAVRHGAAVRGALAGLTIGAAPIRSRAFIGHASLIHPIPRSVFLNHRKFGRTVIVGHAAPFFANARLAGIEIRVVFITDQGIDIACIRAAIRDGLAALGNRAPREIDPRALAAGAERLHPLNHTNLVSLIAAPCPTRFMPRTSNPKPGVDGIFNAAQTLGVVTRKAIAHSTLRAKNTFTMSRASHPPAAIRADARHLPGASGQDQTQQKQKMSYRFHGPHNNTPLFFGRPIG